MIREPQIFQIGSRFPEISTEAICLNGKERMRKIETENLKRRILEFLRKKESFYVSDLAGELNTEPSKVVGAVRELRKEGFIRDVD